MIKSRIKIEDGQIYDFESAYGFVQVSSDDIFGAPIKEFNTTSYPEEAGVHILPLTVHDTFKYKAKFFIRTKGGVDNANWKIEQFNDAISETVDGVKVFKKIEFYNDYKGVKIVGYPTPIAKATEFWRDKNGVLHDVVCVELTIKVVSPEECNFNLANEEYEVFRVIHEEFYVKK